jgi:hypothetical protein
MYLVARTPWKRGPEAGARGPFVVSATRFTYRRRRDLPMVALLGWRLRRGWGRRPGAVGLITGSEPLGRVTYSLSVWRSEDDLRRFLSSPEHVKLVRAYRPRLSDSTSVLWETSDLSPGAAWTEALERLTSTPAPRPRAGRATAR